MTLLDSPTVAFYGTRRGLARDATKIKETVREVGESDLFILGPKVRAFEQALAARVGASHVVATSSGTMALRLAVQALGIRPGDEVIVPAYGFHSTASAVKHLGGTPVLVDSKPAHGTSTSRRPGRRSAGAPSESSPCTRSPRWSTWSRSTTSRPVTRCGCLRTAPSQSLRRANRAAPDAGETSACTRCTPSSHSAVSVTPRR